MTVLVDSYPASLRAEADYIPLHVAVGLKSGAPDVSDPKLKLNALIANRTFEKGLIIYPGGGDADGVNGDHLLLAPPLVITEKEIDLMVSILDETFTEIFKEVGKA